MDEVGQAWGRLVASQKFESGQLDYSIVDGHVQMLGQLSNSGSMSYIFDAFKNRYIHASDNAGKVAGPEFSFVQGGGIDALRSAVHKFDFDTFALMRLRFYAMIFALPAERRKDYKLIHSYRMDNGSGGWVRFEIRQQVLELDPRGNVWLVMGILELAPRQDPELSFECSVVNMKTGQRLAMHEIGYADSDEPLAHPGMPAPAGDSLLTPRETEVLRLIGQGLLSKEISDRLGISINTVNIHRRNILAKTGAGNAIEAIRKAEGL